MAELHAIHMIGVGGQCAERRRRLALGRFTHPDQNVFVCDDCCTLCRIPYVPGNVATRDCAACRGNLLVAAGMIRMNVRINNVSDGFRRRVRVTHPRNVRPGFRRIFPLADAIRVHIVLQLPERRQDLIGHLRQAGVHHQHPVRTHGGRDVSPGAHNHVHGSAYVQHVDFCVGGSLIELPVDAPHQTDRHSESNTRQDQDHPQTDGKFEMLCIHDSLRYVYKTLIAVEANTRPN